MDPSIVSVRDLSRRFETLVAVDRVRFEVRAGEIFGLIGPNGAGKTTLIKILTTLLPATSGSAQVAGFDVAAQAREVRRRIGYVPQLLSADGELTGYENLLLSARLYGIARAVRSRRIEEALEMMGLVEARDRVVKGYSGGMIRRLEIAQSTLHRPQVIFMDEPTVGLDPGGRRAVWNHVRSLRSQFGTAIVLTTHYMEEADELCDRIGVLHLGRLAAVDTPEGLKAKAGPGATLDDVFESLTGSALKAAPGPEAEARGDFRGVRQDRRGVRDHA